MPPRVSNDNYVDFELFKLAILVKYLWGYERAWVESENEVGFIRTRPDSSQNL